MSKADQYYSPDHPVARAVEPLRVAAVERALAHADSTVIKIRQELEAAEWDANKVAPYPDSGKVDRGQYRALYKYYQLVRRVTRPDEKKQPHRLSFQEAEIVQMFDDGIAAYRRAMEEEAEAQYIAYVCKLIRKVEQDGEVQGAELAVNFSGVWGRSRLTVTLADNSTRRWLTKTIINRSPLGTLFNQWPTTREK